MKQHVFLSFVMGLCLAGAAMAQSKSFDAGMKAYESADYKTAIAEYDKALGPPAQVKGKTLVQAYLFRGNSKVVYLTKFRETLPPDVVRSHGITALQDLRLARENDTDGKMTVEIDAATKKAQQLLRDLSGEAWAKTTNPQTPAAEKQAYYKDLIAYNEPLIELDKYNYKAYDYLADGQYGLGDSAKALKNYRLADDWFFRSAPKDGDMEIAYTYISIAQLEWHMNKNFTEAMNALAEGRKRLDAESQKIQSFGNRSAQQRSAASMRRDDIELDLKKAEAALKKAAGKE